MSGPQTNNSVKAPWHLWVVGIVTGADLLGRLLQGIG